MQEFVWRRTFNFEKFHFLFEPFSSNKGEEYETDDLLNQVICKYPHLSRQRQDAIALEEVHQALRGILCPFGCYFVLLNYHYILYLRCNGRKDSPACGAGCVRFDCAARAFDCAALASARLALASFDCMMPILHCFDCATPSCDGPPPDSFDCAAFGYY